MSHTITAIQALIRDGEAARALAALESLQSHAIPPMPLYNEVFGCCAAWGGDWSEAVGVLKRAEAATGERPALAAYQAALDAIQLGMRGQQRQQQQQQGGKKGEGKGAWADRAMRVYDEAVKRAGVLPDGRAVEGVLLPLVRVR